MSTNEPKNEDLSWLRVAGQASFIPIFLALYPIAFYYIGSWLDGYFGLTWLKNVFLLLGVISGFRQSYFVIRRLLEHLEEHGGS